MRWHAWLREGFAEQYWRGAWMHMERAVRGRGENRKKKAPGKSGTTAQKGGQDVRQDVRRNVGQKAGRKVGRNVGRHVLLTDR